MGLTREEFDRALVGLVRAGEVGTLVDAHIAAADLKDLQTEVNGAITKAMTVCQKKGFVVPVMDLLRRDDLPKAFKPPAMATLSVAIDNLGKKGEIVVLGNLFLELDTLPELAQAVTKSKLEGSVIEGLNVCVDKGWLNYVAVFLGNDIPLDIMAEAERALDKGIDACKERGQMSNVAALLKNPDNLSDEIMLKVIKVCDEKGWVNRDSMTALLDRDDLSEDVMLEAIRVCKKNEIPVPGSIAKKLPRLTALGYLKQLQKGGSVAPATSQKGPAANPGQGPKEKRGRVGSS